MSARQRKLLTRSEADELALILREARKLLDWATGARYCECSRSLGASEGFRRVYDPNCPKCEWGLIDNGPWDGDPDSRAVAHAKSTTGGGTVKLEGETLMIWHDASAWELVELGTRTVRCRVTWARVLRELNATQLDLFGGAA